MSVGPLNQVFTSAQASATPPQKKSENTLFQLGEAGGGV